MSSYLNLPADAASFGLPAQVTAAQVRQASDYADSYLRRPEGLVWLPDYSGAPGWMANLTPRLTLIAGSAIAPGQNVVVPVTPSFNTADSVGEVLVLDRTGPNPEMVVISGAAPGQITLASVANAHASGVTLEMGLVILEERQMPNKRSVTRVSRPNFVRLLAGQGRYGYGRRSDQMAGTYNEVNLLATLATFGGPPQWVPFDITQASVSVMTGEVWVPAGMLLAYYTDVRVRYVAGFAASTIPEAIKQATANIALNLATLPPELSSGLIRRVKAGDTEIDRFGHAAAAGRGAGVGNSLIDADTKALLDPYRVRSYF
jgi:hypothetical protein